MVARLAVAVAALVVAPAAFASSPVAEVRGPTGTLLAAARGAPYAYPADGSVLRIGAIRTTAGGLELSDVSLLGGAVQAGRVLVPPRGLSGAAVGRLVVAGRAEAGHPNTLLSLGGPSYVVVLQEAVVPAPGSRRSQGVVGLRLYAGEARPGLPAGSQILVGLARASSTKPASAPAEPWRVLGVASLPVVATGLTGGLEPFAGLPLPPGQSGPIGLRAVALAEQLVGVPYVWGGAAPSEGFDCSGLVMFVYRQLGVGLPHFSGSQWYSGRRVPSSELAPGDLVFFDMGPNGPGHVGIYAGQGSFIEAPHSGAVVRFSSLFDPARGLSYVGAVRPY